MNKLKSKQIKNLKKRGQKQTEKQPKNKNGVKKNERKQKKNKNGVKKNKRKLMKSKTTI